MKASNNMKSEVLNELSNTKPLVNSEKLFSFPINELLTYLDTSLSGLTSEKVEQRLETYGYNELAKKKERTEIIKFLLHFNSPLVIILLLAGLISIFFGEIINASIIFSIVVISVVLLFYQESKAEKAAEMLREKITTTATVLRNNSKKRALNSRGDSEI